jgi:hypothetical protein
LKLGPGALADATVFLKNKADTQVHFERVSDLVEGFESPFGLELLSTVHWIAIREPVQSVDDVVAGTYAWNDRKKTILQAPDRDCDPRAVPEGMDRQRGCTWDPLTADRGPTSAKIMQAG